MKDVNKIILVGRLGNDPTLSTTKNGTSMTYFSVATTRKFRESKSDDTSERGELRELTVWHRIVVWGKEAENCANYLKKGNLVFVEGNVRTRKYQKEGEDRFISEVHAESVSFLGGGRSTRDEPIREETEAASA